MSELPRGWILTQLGELLRAPLRNGHSAKETNDPNGVRILTLTAVTTGDFSAQNTKITSADPSRVAGLWLEPGDLLIERSNTPELVGTTRLYKGPKHFAVFPDLVIRAQLAEQIVPRFAELVLQSRALRHYFQKHAKGMAGSMPKIDQQTISEAPIPLPPLAEQKRIVAKIEELFSELEAGEESLRAARRQLGVYRQSLLKQAFEGKLTEKWRAENPDKLEKWTWTTVGKIGRIETGTTPPTDNQANYGGDLPFFKPTDLEQGRYVKDARSYLSASGRQSARVLPAGSILVTCIGATIGKTGLAQVACATNQQINSISPAEGVEPEFAYFQVISPQFQEQIKINASSTTLPILNKSKFSALPFVRCSLPEQQEIVRLLDEQFEAIERNEREIDAALKRSEALRQAILKKAFTGQLVPQDPADEPASELLARLRKVVTYPEHTDDHPLMAAEPCARRPRPRKTSCR